MKRTLIIPWIISLVVMLFSSSTLTADDDFPNNIIGKDVYVEKDGRMVRCKVLKVDLQGGRAYMETYWNGKKREGWMPLQDLRDRDGWPYYVPPHEVGDEVEIEYKGEWIKAKVEEVRGERIRVRLEAGNVRVVNAKDARRPTSRKPVVEDKNDAEMNGDEDEEDDDDSPAPHSSGKSTKYYKDGQWLTSGVVPPKRPEGLELGQEIYVLHEDIWQKGVFTALSRESFTVKFEGDREVRNIKVKQLSLEEPDTYVRELAFERLDIRKRLDGEAEPAGKWRIPAMDVPNVGEVSAAAARMDDRNNPRSRPRIEPLNWDAWNSRFMLGGSYLTNHTDNSTKRYTLVHDLVRGRTVASLYTPPGWIANAVNTSGTQLALLGKASPFQDRLMLMDISNPDKPILETFDLNVPRTGSRYYRQVFTGATYLNDDNLLLLGDDTAMLVNVAKRRIDWLLRDTKSKIIRQDGRLMACQTSQGLAMVELPSGKFVGRSIDTKNTPMAFTPDGKNLALSATGGFKLMNLQNLQLGELFIMNGGIACLLDDYVIDSRGTIYDLELNIPIWQLQGATDVRYNGTFGAKPYSGSSSNYLLAFELPIDEWDTVISDEAKIHDAVLIGPGMRVDLNVNADGPSNNSLRERLEKQIEQRGWVIDRQAAFSINAKREKSETEEQHYNVIGGPDETLNITTTYYSLTINFNDTELWRRTTSFRDSPGVILRGDETLRKQQQEARSRDKGLFSRTYLPVRVLKPEYQNGFGAHTISPLGLQRVKQ